MSEDIVDLANRHVSYLLDEGDSESVIVITGLVTEVTRLRSDLKNDYDFIDAVARKCGHNDFCSWPPTVSIERHIDDIERLRSDLKEATAERDNLLKIMGMTPPGTRCACRFDEGDKPIATCDYHKINVRLLKEAVAALETAEEALDNYADAEINEVGHSVGNAAMTAYMEVHDTLAKIKGAA